MSWIVRAAGLLGLLAAGAASQELGPAEAAPPRSFDLQHIRLDLSFDRPARRVHGVATLRLAALRDGLAEVALDGAGLSVSSISEGGRARKFSNDGRRIRVRMDPPLSAAHPVELEIRYSARPRRGLYFVQGRPDYPRRPEQIYSQGFPQDNRYWFPAHDFPNDKVTSEILLTVPAGWDVMSNGRLAERKEQGGQIRFHWLQDKPHSTYLISFVAGELDRVEENWRGLPLVYYVPRGRAAWIPATFGRVPAMMELFSRRLGPYPWAQYAQCVLEESVYGGMENTGAVTLAPRHLPDPRLEAEEQESNDATLAHELAHQWLGDLITVEDFRHVWLSEGFATYFENLWTEHNRGAAEAAWKRRESARGITGALEASRFPLVRRGPDPSDPVVLLAYQKGAWMVHMIRRQLGDDLFWRAMREWISEYGLRNVRTADLAASIRKSTGRDLDWLFEQFAYGEGHPRLDLKWRWQDGRVRLSVRQKGKVFHIPADADLAGDGFSVRRRVQLGRETEDFDLQTPGPPRMVLFDPEEDWLKEVTFEKTPQEWIYQLAHAPGAGQRADALAALSGLKPESRAVIAALDGAGRDSFWGVRAEAVRSLPQARLALKDSDLRVRLAAVRGIRDYRLVLESAQNDPSFTVREAALYALAEFRTARTFDALRGFLATDSPRGMLAAAALSGIARFDNPAAPALLLEWSAPGRPEACRAAAIRGLGSRDRGGSAGRGRLIEGLGSASASVRRAAVDALRRRGESEAIPELERASREDPLESIAAQARRAVETLKAAR